MVASCQDGLKWLGEHKLISWNGTLKTYAAEPLGKATLAAGLDPDSACIIRKVSLPVQSVLQSVRLAVTLMCTPHQAACRC